MLNKVKKLLESKDSKGLYEFICNNQIDKNTASEIFCLIYDHTNSFKNANTTSDTMNIAEKLIDIGVPHDKIVLEKTKKSFPRMKFIGEVLKIVKSHDSGKIILGNIDSILFEKYNENEDTLDLIINEILFSVKNVEVAIFRIKSDNGSKNFIRFKDPTKNNKLNEDNILEIIK